MLMRTLVIAALCVVVVARPTRAQSDPTRAWRGELAVLNDAATGSHDTRQAHAAALRRQIADWAALNPAIAVGMPPAPPLPWSAEQLTEQIAVLGRTIEQIASRHPNQTFYLGVTTVNVTAPVATLSPVSDSLDRVEIQNRQALTVDQAIEYIPGVSVDHKAPRNQTGISIGGFDSRQVPLYLDGIPAYLPFDGYVDLTRYLTSDVAEVDVGKGYSSPLLGPNLLGGVVNVVTRAPQKAFESDAYAGTAAGHQVDSGLAVGARWRTLFVQGSVAHLQSDFYRLSGSFVPSTVQRDERRVNSDHDDTWYRVRMAWTPRPQDRYVLTYANQDGATGIPPYSGTAPPCPPGNAPLATPCVTPKFWKWPFWNSDSYYFNSSTAVGALSSMQVRAFYAGYSNRIDMFDDATYSSMNLNAASGMARNDDHSLGMSGEFETRVLRRHRLGASFFVKDDTHHEQTTTFSRDNVGTTTPVQADRDRQSSFGIRDVITVSPALRATLGFSADHLNGLEAQDLSADRSHVVPFQVAGVCSAASGSFESCTDHVWSYNPVAALTYSLPSAGTVFATYVHKSRFPTMRDRYSYKAGRALPNPTLDPERARTWTAGYSRTIASRTVAQVDVFRSAVRDEIENIFFLSPLCSGGGRAGAGSCQQAVNVGAELHNGVNLTLRTTAVPRLTVDANYSFVDREISGVTGAFPTGTPTHKMVAAATARLAHDVLAHVAARHYGGIVAMSDNGLPLPASTFTTVDVGATIPFPRGVSVQGGVKNLFDANYYYWEGFPEAGLNGYVKLRYLF